MSAGDFLLNLLGVLLVLSGVLGTLLPVIPSTPFIFGGLWLIAWVDHYEHVGATMLSVLAGLMVLTIVLDFIAGALGAKRAGASREALLGATLGSIFGVFGGVLGIVLGPFIGAALGEFYARKDLIRAGNVALATWLGLVLGSLAKVVLALMMVGLFLIAWFF